jgi:hypothetical protein
LKKEANQVNNFATGRAMSTAVTLAAQKAAGGRGKVDVKRNVDQAFYDRFLCRIFSEQDGPFLLKGGTRMLAAVPNGRATKDVDLEAREHTLEAAISNLKRLAGIDLGDFLVFTYTGHKDAGGENQPNVQAAAVKFDVAIVGVGQQSPLRVDLAMHRRPNAIVVRSAPAFRLEIPEFKTFEYAMIAIEDQIADKVCAIMSEYGVSGRGSSRAKDLVDLVILALHQEMSAANLRQAIRAEAMNRALPLFDSIDVPDAIRDGYAKLASTVTPIDGFRTWAEAAALVNLLIEPILSDRVVQGLWSPKQRTWLPSLT